MQINVNGFLFIELLLYARHYSGHLTTLPPFPNVTHDQVVLRTEEQLEGNMSFQMQVIVKSS